MPPSSRPPSASVPVAIHFDHGTTYERSSRGRHRLHLGDARRVDARVRGQHRPDPAGRRRHIPSGSRWRRARRNRQDRRRGQAGTEHISTPTMSRRTSWKTGVDSLAVAIGTRHGITSHLENTRLKRPAQGIKAAVPARGPPRRIEQPRRRDRRVRELGVNKINISSDIRSRTTQKMREVPGRRAP